MKNIHSNEKNTLSKSLSMDSLVSEIIINKKDDKTKKTYKNNIKKEENENREIFTKFSLENAIVKFKNADSDSKKEIIKNLKNYYIQKHFDGYQEFLNSLIYYLIKQDCSKKSPIGVSKTTIIVITILAPILAFFLPAQGALSFPYLFLVGIMWILMCTFSLRKMLPENLMKQLNELYFVLNTPNGENMSRMENKSKNCQIPQAIVLASIGLDVENINDEDFQLKTVEQIVKEPKFLNHFLSLKYKNMIK